MFQEEGLNNYIKLSVSGLFLLGMALLLAGCGYKNRNIMFKTPKKIEQNGLPVVHFNRDTTEDISGYEHLILPDDRIAVRFLNNYDIEQGITITEAGSTPLGLTFLVDKRGFVNLPMVGKVHVGGLDKMQAGDSLEKVYSRNFRDPNIDVSILGLSVSVLGEVTTPGVYELDREKTTLIELISRAGGITQYGKKKIVKIIRGVPESKKPEIIVFDLTQIEAIEKEELILRDKDIVYVEPRNIRVIGEAIAPYTSFLSIVSTLSGVTVLVISLTR